MRGAGSKKFLLVVAGLLIGAGVAEIGLRIAGLPVFQPATIKPTQFAVFLEPVDGVPLHVNSTSARLRFVYASNPRGYFGPAGEVDHLTNAVGFRGDEFEETKPPDTLRIAFLGDSFTFGEGVRFEDTYAETTARLLEQRLGDRSRVQSYNFGVGGLNTRQALAILRNWGLLSRPDIVVLGYVLNDAEPPLFTFDPTTGELVRRGRETEIPENVGEPSPPPGGIYRSRLVQLVWRFRQGRLRTTQMIDYYRALYRADAPGWLDSRAALTEMAALCRAENIPLYVLSLPILLRLDDYPFAEETALVRGVAESAGARYVDPLPALAAHRADQLWVHPTDQHPNERAHALIAAVLAERLGNDLAMEASQSRP